MSSVAAKTLAWVPGIAAVLAALISFAIMAGFSIVLVAIAVLMLGIGVPPALFTVRRAAARAGEDYEVSRLRIRVLIAAVLAWLLTWAATSLGFAALNGIASLFLGFALTFPSAEFFGTFFAASYPLPIIHAVTTAILLPFAARRPAVKPSD